MDNTNVTMVSIPVGYVCIRQPQYDALQEEVAKNQELFDNLVAYLQGERDYTDARPIRRMLGMNDGPEEDE